MRISRALLWMAFVIAFGTLLPGAGAQSTAPAAAPDLLIFTNGDQLTGKLMHSTGSNVTFHSDMAGDVTVSWSKVKQLRSQRQFVVLGKEQNFDWRSMRKVYAGSIDVENNKIQITGEKGIQTTPIGKTADVLDLETFHREALHEVNFFRRWTGSMSLGTALVRGTQATSTLNGSVGLVRNTPAVAYLPPRNRTLVDFTGSYSEITQRQAKDAPPQPNLKITIYHANAERDEYLTSRVYVLGQLSFDHNFSQGLDLQQIYGAGMGMTVIKRARQQLDLRATLQYEKQEFSTSSIQSNTNLVGSTFGVKYLLKLPFGGVFEQQFLYLPAYNEPEAYSASENNSITLPLYKRLGLNIGTVDNYLNNPPITVFPAPLNEQNTFQFTTGISYSLK